MASPAAPKRKIRRGRTTKPCASHEFCADPEKVTSCFAFDFAFEVSAGAPYAFRRAITARR